MNILASIWSLFDALRYFVCHPFEHVSLTIVRRYVDAQGHYIGELYNGSDRAAKMIGASCDNWPLDATTSPLGGKPRLCWRESFLAPLPANTLRVGALRPEDNATVQAYVARRRFCTLQISVLNRFVEHILEAKKI